MPLSEIWTIETAGSPGTAQTLAGLGITDASLSRASQAEGVLSLDLAGADALTAADPWPWKTHLALRRDGVIVFRGWVTTLPRTGAPGSESRSVEIRDLWWMLARTPYTQVWTSLGVAGALAAARSGRAQLGLTQSGIRENTKSALAQVVAAAVDSGLALTLDADDLPDLIPPPIEATNQSCADLLRAILRWHPDAVARLVHGEATDTLQIVPRTTATTVSFALGTAPLAAIPSLTPRLDLVTDAVHVIYEADARSFGLVGEEDEEVVQAPRRLALFRDIYPPDSPITDTSLVATLPTPNVSPPPPSQPHRQPVQTRPLPATGAFDANAEKFWLWALGWEALGLTSDDIRLPTSTVLPVQAHRVRFAWAVANEPPEPPSAINPESTPLWRPASVSDLPRVLVGGTLADWMGVKAADVVVDCTIGVRKSTVDALPDRAKKVILSRQPKPSQIAGVDAYLIDAQVNLKATTAKTKTYVNWPSVGSSGDASADTVASVEAALERAVIPGLAEQLWTARQALPWEGSIRLVQLECPVETYLGSTVSITGGHADWATMASLVQAESLALESGTTTLTLGAPEHLTPQDFYEIHRAARAAQMSRAEGGAGGSPPSEPEQDEEGDGGIIGGSITPIAPAPQITGEEAEVFPWSLEIVDASAGTVRVRCGTIIADLADLTTIVDITNDDNVFSPEPGDRIWLKFDDVRPTTAMLEVGAGWGDDSPYVRDGSEETLVMVSYNYELWEFAETGLIADGWTPIKSGLCARRVGEISHFKIIHAAFQVDGEYPLFVPILDSYQRARVS
jgi:hypothetical protein